MNNLLKSLIKLSGGGRYQEPSFNGFSGHSFSFRHAEDIFRYVFIHKVSVIISAVLLFLFLIFHFLNEPKLEMYLALKKC